MNFSAWETYLGSKIYFPGLKMLFLTLETINKKCKNLEIISLALDWFGFLVLKTYFGSEINFPGLKMLFLL